MPSALLILNLGAPFRIRAGTDIEPAEYADGCVVTTPTRAFEFGYPLRTRSVGVHFKPWGPAPFLPMPAAELMRRLRETVGLRLIRHTSNVIAATNGAVAIGDLSVAAGVSSTHLTQRFKELIGVTPKRLARAQQGQRFGDGCGEL
ncbi:hypothetical protein [Nonomuraea jabiensis]|uniref:hypothetical protein n=1 Tax=Nonomuraea jabiensis TaxID=882448 RepID=UPI003D70D35D